MDSGLPGSKIDLVAQGILQQIATGVLRPGDRVRSIRDEAQLLGVAKNTVVDAYIRLVAQGVLQSRPGSGYYVSRGAAAPVRSKISPFAGIPNGAALLTEQLERRLLIRPGDGRLPADWLGDAQLRRALSAIKLTSPEAYNYNTARGFPLLRERLCGTLGERGIDCTPDQILMTHGANHAMDLIIRSYVRPGDAVLVDEPGYYPLFSKLHIAGARIIGVRRQHDGPDVDDFVAKARSSGALLFFTQSLAHNPTGGSITLARAFALLKAAASEDMLIIEDDPFADILPYATPRLASLDQLERVIYIGSFSKTLAGSFRSGYIAASRSRTDELTELAVVTMVSTSAHNERLIHALMEQGHYLRHLRRLTLRLAEAVAKTIEGLEGLGFQIARPANTGFYLWLHARDRAAEVDLVADAAKNGIFIAPARAFSVSGEDATTMRINVAYGSDPTFLRWLGDRLTA
ncbi:PLP-dependent aminotransferase family protein [Acidisoma cellulosilytica]|uniref:PLP-dependent aminotransferase family protein n=1 Tax=Acidisoma cellulosilyticum TaxID=2802395 RepID=A0A963Z345_9PROT|nr:PLP-dependent aminotransferase family protein [Acidisoma cellulosilyticum]MCB8881097.1 PLP-dependent aminotransferase family protein [Acidisoma cellulosilyticum]